MQKRVELFIDTSSNETIEVGVSVDGEKEVINEPLTKNKAQVVLPIIEQLLSKHHLTVKDLTSITVAIGPGSFTGLRVGISIANTLGVVLKIPINGQPVGKIVTAVYS